MSAIAAAWFVYPGGTVTAACDEMWATRDIEPGEEITFGAHAVVACYAILYMGVFKRD